MGRAAEKPDPALVRMVRELLDRIAAAEGQENDVREEVLEAAGDEFDALAGPELVPALLRPVGRSQARRTRAVLLLCYRRPERGRDRGHAGVDHRPEPGGALSDHPVDPHRRTRGARAASRRPDRPGAWPFGVHAYAGREDNDLILWLPLINTIVSGDSLSDFGDGPEIQLGGRKHVTRDDVVRRLRPLLDLPVELCCPLTVSRRIARHSSVCFSERADRLALRPRRSTSGQPG